eukprot:7501378-Pyramimonas_sp.AAC.1
MGFVRCLVPLGLELAPQPAAAERSLRAGALRRAGFSGTVCIDGSAFFPQLVEITRTGWTGIMVTTDGRVLGGVLGTVPGLVQEI